MCRLKRIVDQNDVEELIKKIDALEREQIAISQTAKSNSLSLEASLGRENMLNFQLLLARGRIIDLESELKSINEYKQHQKNIKQPIINKIKNFLSRIKKS